MNTFDFQSCIIEEINTIKEIIGNDYFTEKTIIQVSEDKIINIETIKTKVVLSTLNIDLSDTNAFGFTFGPNNVITIINIAVMIPAIPIATKNGILYTPALFG